jgi:hypothetical protein
LGALGFEVVLPEATRRPAYHPGVLLKIYVYTYINQIASSRPLEREAQRNVELMWLTGRLAPDFKTIADFRKDNGPAIRATWRLLDSAGSQSRAQGWRQDRAKIAQVASDYLVRVPGAE